MAFNISALVKIISFYMYIMKYSFDAREFFLRLVKYFLEGFVVAVAAFFIPKGKVSVNEILTIGLTAAATFSLLDLFAPSISGSVRSGAGLVMGGNLVGGLKTIK